MEFAYKLWHKYFRDQIYQLTQQFSETSITSEGSPFWTGTKIYPKFSEFDADNDDNIKFNEDVSNLWADMFSLNHVTQKTIKKWIATQTPPKIQTGKKIKLPGEKEAANNDNNDEVDNDKKMENLVSALPDEKDMQVNVKSLEFEKDIDTNFHIDFVTSASNLRAYNYTIQRADKLKTKGIAGKIIPAIATTTSLVSGLVALELIKTIQKFNKNKARCCFAG
mgnify:CR=1 FL=1